MKKLAFILALMAGAASMSSAQQNPPPPPAGPVRTPPLRLTSSAFADGTMIPLKYTQAAPDMGVSPELTWTSVPPGTQSFVLWMHDLDLSIMRTSEDNLHWIVWNIPGQSTSLPEGVPKGAQLADGSSQLSYNGAWYRGPGAPATGPLHHYVFELYALDIKLDPAAGTNAVETRTKIFAQMQGHIIGKASYVGLFKRPG